MDESHMSPTVPLDRWKIESDYFDTRRHKVTHQHEKQIANLVILEVADFLETYGRHISVSLTIIWQTPKG